MLRLRVLSQCARNVLFWMSRLQCLTRTEEKEVLKTVEELRKREHVTVILITHYMEEVIGADRVIVMDQGHVVMDGTTREIFSQVELLKKYRLDVPQVTMLAYGLKQRGLDISDGILTTEELIEALEKRQATGRNRIRKLMSERQSRL